MHWMKENPAQKKKRFRNSQLMLAGAQKVHDFMCGILRKKKNKSSPKSLRENKTTGREELVIPHGCCLGIGES